jgi:DNA gyrase subunit A
VPLDEYNAKGRYTQGNWTTDHRRLDEVGPIVAARVVHPQDQITIMTSHGIVMRTPVHGISRMGRATRGVRIVNLQGDDSVAALTVITHDDLTRGVDGGTEDETLLASTVNGSDNLNGTGLNPNMADDVEEGGLEEAPFDDIDLEDAATEPV